MGGRVNGCVERLGGAISEFRSYRRGRGSKAQGAVESPADTTHLGAEVGRGVLRCGERVHPSLLSSTPPREGRCGGVLE